MDRKRTRFGRIGIGLACVAALWGLSGCGGKDTSDAKTAQQVQDFKGHQPTPEQLQAAISRTSQHPSVPGPPNAPKQ